MRPIDRGRGTSRPHLLLLLVICALFMSACETAVTPVADRAPTRAPTDSPLPTDTPVPTFRYGIAQHTLDYIPLDRLGDTVQVEAFADHSDATAYDVALAFGRYDGWQVATTHNIALIVNTDLAPLDTERIAGLIYASIDAPALVASLAFSGAEAQSTATIDPRTAKTTLANAGYPDGFQLVVAYEATPVLDALVAQWSRINVDVRHFAITRDDVDGILRQNRAHVILLQTSDHPDARPLLTIPVSYVTAPAIAVTIDESGLPIITP
jgi:hypothetical protein